MGLTDKMTRVRKNGHVDKNVKVENCIGFTQVPLGIAGPLTIYGAHQKGSILAPLATTEAALVASCSRGCKALQKNGVRVTALAEGVSRAPIFYFKTVDEAVSFYQQIPSLESQFKQDAEKTSRYARLTKLTPHIIGASVHVKFDFNCGDAAGQNMVKPSKYTSFMTPRLRTVHRSQLQRKRHARHSSRLRPHEKPM